MRGAFRRDVRIGAHPGRRPVAPAAPERRLEDQDPDRPERHRDPETGDDPGAAKLDAESFAYGAGGSVAADHESCRYGFGFVRRRILDPYADEVAVRFERFEGHAVAHGDRG